jgi:hypothetical protein
MPCWGELRFAKDTGDKGVGCLTRIVLFVCPGQLLLALRPCELQLRTVSRNMGLEQEP